MPLKLERCTIRSWRAEDATCLATNANNRKIWLGLRDLFPHPYTINDANEFLQRAMSAQPARPRRKPAAPPRAPRPLPKERITVDDLRHKALSIEDMVKVEAKQRVADNRVRIIIAVAVVGAVTLSVAYYLGTRRGRRLARK